MYKKIHFVFILFGLCLFPLSAQVTKAYLQNMYMSYLQEQGYASSIDSDGDIKFKFEGGTYYIVIHENDPKYFQIVYPYFWEIESANELAQVKTVISYVNRTTKIAKVFLVRDEVDVSISAESLLNQPEDFKNHLSRLLSCIGTARTEFRSEMNR